jgi:hypothetical protein
VAVDYSATFFRIRSLLFYLKQQQEQFLPLFETGVVGVVVEFPSVAQPSSLLVDFHDC